MMEKRLPSRVRRKRNLKIKKSTIGMLSMVFAFVFAIFHVFAGNNNTITLETKNANRGDTVNLKINLDCKQAYNSALIELEFDTDVLTYVRTNSLATIANPAAVEDGADEINLIATAPNKAADVEEANATGKVSIGYLIDGETACESIQMAIVRFTVKEDAPFGESPITVSAGMAREENEVKETLTVDTVDGAVVLSLPVDPDSVGLAEENITVQKGETAAIEVEYSPENTTDDKTFTYTGYDEDIISVASDGTITGLAVGTTDVTVTAFGQTLTAHVTVENHVKTVTVTGSTHDIEKDGELTLSAAMSPNDAQEVAAGVTWSSSSESIATVDENGVVTGVAAGTATITATSSNGVAGTFDVNVIVPITSFTTSDADLQLAKGDSHTINYTILPAEPSESTTITWVSSDESVVTVSNGVISAMGGGTATITGSLGQTKNNIQPITINVTVNVPLTSVTLDEESISLLPTQEQKLNATLDPSDATHKDITWTSSNEDVATVDNEGNVTAVAPGDATITARVAAEDKQDTVSVHVMVPISGAVINKSSVTLAKGENDTLSVTISPSNAEETYTVSWASADSSSVSVDADGKITALKGTQEPVRITGTLSNAAHTQVTCDVTVVVPLTDISLNKSTLTLDKGNNETLSVSYDPEDTSDDKTVSWTSGDDSIATVDSTGKVTAVGKGVTTITATVGTHSKNCQVTVNVPVTSVTISGGDFELDRSDTKTLSAVIAPSDASETTITWASDDTSIATVDSNGVVTGVAAGEANITASVGGKSDSVKVTVVVPITSFTTPEPSKTILRKETFTISTTINPNDTTEDKTITWTSNKTNVATVDSNGKVTGVGEGTAAITGTLPNDMSVTVSVTVQIVPVTSITVSEETLELKRKQSTDEPLTVTYAPENATEVSDVTWTSSDESVATVDENGVVTGVAEGTATITAHMGQLTDTVEVTVIEIPLEGVTLEDNKTETEVGQKYQIIPKLEPLDATDDVTYTFESSDPEIATVDAEGNVTTKKAGKVKITIKASNGVEEFEDTIELTINTPSSPQTGVTPIWIYGIMMALLLIIGVVIYKKKELF